MPCEIWSRPAGATCGCSDRDVVSFLAAALCSQLLVDVDLLSTPHPAGDEASAIKPAYSLNH